MSRWLLDGITQRIVPTDRIRANVLAHRPDQDAPGPPVVFIHGNVSSSLFWQRAMLDLSIRSIAIDLRGFGETETRPVDATRGLADFADDVTAVLDALGERRVALAGWSMGGGVAMQLTIDHPERVVALALVSPVSPYGFGGTAGPAGRPLTEDSAGTGGGGVNPDFVARLTAHDTSAEAETSPRQVMRSTYFAPGFSYRDEDMGVASMLSTAIGPQNYPGTSRPSTHWPGFAAGDTGVLNAMAPRYLDVSGLAGVNPKPPVLWVRGDRDVIVSDHSALDLNGLGQAGLVPDWPGEEIAPPQPMVTQMRAVLDRYAAGGGRYRELVVEGAGHSPQLERPEVFVQALRELLATGPARP